MYDDTDDADISHAAPKEKRSDDNDNQVDDVDPPADLSNGAQGSGDATLVVTRRPRASNVLTRPE